MGDLVFWGMAAIAFMALIWAWWPMISRGLRITANEGDEAVANIEKARKEIKRDIKTLKNKITK